VSGEFNARKKGERGSVRGSLRGKIHLPKGEGGAKYLANSGRASVLNRERNFCERKNCTFSLRKREGS